MGQAGAQSGPGGARGGHGHGGGNTNPLFAALDQNQDGQLSLAELRAAAAVMKTLDKNGDGLLSLAECAQAGGGGHGQPNCAFTLIHVLSRTPLKSRCWLTLIDSHVSSTHMTHKVKS
jgi:hypothetical protein